MKIYVHIYGSSLNDWRVKEFLLASVCQCFHSVSQSASWVGDDDVQRHSISDEIHFPRLLLSEAEELTLQNPLTRIRAFKKKRNSVDRSAEGDLGLQGKPMNKSRKHFEETGGITGGCGGGLDSAQHELKKKKRLSAPSFLLPLRGWRRRSEKRQWDESAGGDRIETWVRLRPEPGGGGRGGWHRATLALGKWEGVLEMLLWSGEAKRSAGPQQTDASTGTEMIPLAL